MTDREPLADIVARLQVAIRPHATKPVTVHRTPADSPPPNGLAMGYGTRKNTMANTLNGGGSCHYKPRAADFANNITPATSRPNPNASVRPSGNRRVTGATTVRRNGKRMPSVTWERARDSGANEGMRTQLVSRHNTAIAAGEMPAPGIHFKP